MFGSAPVMNFPCKVKPPLALSENQLDQLGEKLNQPELAPIDLALILNRLAVEILNSPLLEMVQSLSKKALSTVSQPPLHAAHYRSLEQALANRQSLEQINLDLDQSELASIDLVRILSNLTLRVNPSCSERVKIIATKALEKASLLPLHVDYTFPLTKALAQLESQTTFD